jgi:hypothetical protein
LGLSDFPEKVYVQNLNRNFKPYAGIVMMFLNQHLSRSANRVAAFNLLIIQMIIFIFLDCKFLGFFCFVFGC